VRSKLNWVRGLKRLWLLAAIPWVVYAFGEFDVDEKVGYAWLYYTDRQGLIDELRSPAAVAGCASTTASDAMLDRIVAEQKSLTHDNVDALARGEGILETMRREGTDAALDSRFRREEERKKKEFEECKAREPEAIALCKDRVPEAPDLRWIIPVLVVPTYGVAFSALAVWLAFLTIRWAWRGFYS